MSGHTPGPWATEYVGDDGFASDRPTVAIVGDYRIVRDGHSVRGYDGHAADEADARLIAAAPDLLAALKAVLRIAGAGSNDADEDRSEFDAAAALADAALTKAEPAMSPAPSPGSPEAVARYMLTEIDGALAPSGGGNE